MLTLCVTMFLASGAHSATGEEVAEFRVDEGHPWRPPYGLDHVGKPVEVVVRLTSEQPPSAAYKLLEYRKGERVGEKEVALRWRDVKAEAPASGKHEGLAMIATTSRPDELVLVARDEAGEDRELGRIPVKYPAVDAEAIAEPEERVHPVDLGAIFVPHGWLLIGAEQKAVVDVAVVVDAPAAVPAHVKAWFASAPVKTTETPLELQAGVRATCKLRVEPAGAVAEKDVLHIALIDAGGAELWHKEIQTMRVIHPPALPRFGATELRLRYDLPITVNHGEAGKLGELTHIDYDKGWDPKLRDVVVSLPSGGRFVFWRGSSYIPFWAGPHNTGMCYEWAETGPPPDGFVDSVEPLMDKELRYGRVRIVESTASRVHVRWTYQSTDFNYKVWGDQAVEDFYFYPDGFGTRVLTLTSEPDADYELSEFIVLSPPGAYPFGFLPRHAVELLYLDGQKHALSFPPDDTGPERLFDKFAHVRKIPVVYRIRMHKDDPAGAIYFHPSEDHYPAGQFGPLYDRGHQVTPAYWGSHWPLSRGKSTGWAIDDRIAISPAHNSLVSWARHRPAPLTRTQARLIDTLGRSKPMIGERWAWLIGMSDADDARLLQWARSFAAPPSVEVTGATLDAEAYAPERRAIRLKVDGPLVSILIKPDPVTVNPVFELLSAPPALAEVKLDDQPLPPERYTWDGKTLWLDATLDKPGRVQIKFE